MIAKVEYIDVERGPGFYRVVVKIENSTLELVNGQMDFMDDEAKANDAAAEVNEDILKYLKQIIRFSEETKKEYDREHNYGAR